MGRNNRIQRWMACCMSVLLVLVLVAGTGVPLVKAEPAAQAQWEPSEQTLSVWGSAMSGQEGYTAYIRDRYQKNGRWRCRYVNATVVWSSIYGYHFMAAFDGCEPGWHYLRVLCKGKYYYGSVYNDGSMMTVSVQVNLR